MAQPHRVLYIDLGTIRSFTNYFDYTSVPAAKLLPVCESHMASPGTEAILVDTSTELENLLRDVSRVGTKPGSDARFFLDLEGSISIIQVYIQDAEPKLYLLDVHALKESAFDHALSGLRWTSFRQFLEDEGPIKVFFDVRNDSHVMHRLYRVKLDGIRDLQLMELGSREGARKKRHINGLAKCITMDINMSQDQESRWMACKEAGQRLYLPNLGGKYEVWDERPLGPLLLEYCSQDTWCLPRLYDLYYGKLTTEWLGRVDVESKARVVDSQRADYDRNGRNRTRGPPTWQTIGD